MAVVAAYKTYDLFSIYLILKFIFIFKLYLKWTSESIQAFG